MEKRTPANGRSKKRIDGKTTEMEPFRERAAGEYLTSNQGLRISHTDDSLKAGERGPTLLEDFHFREKIMHFDHERIPERVVHARGMGAFGTFQVYEPMTAFTKARFLQDPAVTTPVFVRFSTVAGSRGSADTVRDVRGFATKFYTEEGVFDLVGNNIPIFFIQDAIKFPDLIHAVKPEPHNEIPQAATAHDTAYDFFSLLPEATPMVLWVLSDRALPRSVAMMEGFGIHTFRFVNAEGKARFVKFHWKPLLGVHSLLWEESQQLAGKDADWLRRDLWEAIEHGTYPEYEFGVQIIEEEDEFAFNVDILDATKIWPEELVPVRRIGKMTLDRNPDNFFAQTEQVAFHPGHVVPGIDFTDDPLLQGRLFSYLDTQLSRLGSANFAEIPINRPLAPVHNNQRDGHMRQTINTGRAGYYPNSLGGGCPMLAPESAGGYVPYPERVNGPKVRARGEQFRDYYSQATLFWRSLSPAEQQHLVAAAHFELGKVEAVAVRERMVGHFNEVDHDLAVRVAAGIGVAAPTGGNTNDRPATFKGKSVARSPALSSENTAKGAMTGRRVAILAADGVDDTAVQAVKRAVMDAGAQAEVIATALGTVEGVSGKQIPVDKSAITVASVLYDAVFVPGGARSAEALAKEGDAIHFLNEAYKHGKPIGAAGEGMDVLARTDIPSIVTTGKPGGVINDAGVVVARNAADIEAFARAFIAAIGQHRFWARSQKEQVPA